MPKKSTQKTFSKYGLDFTDQWSPLEIEMHCIQNGGRWEVKGKSVGEGLLTHFLNARALIWPHRYRHRWTDLMYSEFIKNDVTILLGAASSQKTSHAVEFCLINYWARPDNTLVILSTVNMAKMDIGVWAELKMLWQSGRDNHPSLAGKLIEYKHAITTDDIAEGQGRDFRKGCIARPCYVGGRWVGLGVLAGTKQDYIFYVADELQFMEEAFAASWPHLFANGKVKIIGAGNPKHDPEDQLAIAGEPIEGWNAHPEPQKTEVWNTRKMGARCINLVGTDSPNFDVPEGARQPFERLIGRDFANRIAHDYGPDSFQYYQLVKGVMRVAFAHSRVITRQLCRDHHALDKAEWLNTTRNRIYCLDPSYGGDDRCIGMCIEWGEDKNGKTIMRPLPYRVFQMKLNVQQEVEDQIADILAEELGLYGIKPADCFYDSVGKGTLGGPFARKFGHETPTAVDSGDTPTKRPVREGLFVEEIDPMTGLTKKRPKRCDEHYSKFVSEMWFSSRYVIEAGQMRELAEDVMVEGCARIYEIVTGNKIQVEAKSDPKKKEDLKRRLGKSPDLYDCLCVGIEGARRKGFKIGKLGDLADVESADDDWFDIEAEKWENIIKSKLIQHT